MEGEGMSAIWGMIRTNHLPIEATLPAGMAFFGDKYAVDRVDEILDASVYFACAHQHVTPQSKWERLPYHDAERGIYYTADCILDNRDRLAEQLGLREYEKLPDAAIAYEAYLVWGERFVTRLLGIFSIAIYDEKRDIFLLYTDHTGCRCINYAVEGQEILFSTTYDWFRVALDKRLRLSQTWMTGCVREPSACMIVFPGLTPYENVFQVRAGHYVRVCGGKVRERCYYNPGKTKMARFDSEEAYRKHYIEVFENCVRDILRPGVKVAATLSGGLDSTSVVSVAAPILKARGEALPTYTSVPDPEFELESDGYHMADESPLVRKTAECLGNLEPHFVACEGESPMTHLNEWVDVYGFPLKSSVNLLWLDRVSKQAAGEGCTVMLSGQHGNATISYGDIFTLAYQDVLHLKPLRAKREVREFLQVNHIPKENFKRVLKQNLAEKWAALRGREVSEEPVRFARTDAAERRKIDRQRHADVRRHGTGSLNSHRQKRRLPYQLAELQQLGMYNTMDSLVNGIVERDPTRDRRMIELCISYPVSCFVAHGMERHMVRGFLEGIVPDHVRLDVRHRGAQGADYLQRVNRSWAEHKQEVLQNLKNPYLKEYLDEEALRKLIDDCGKADRFDEENSKEVIFILYYAALGRFLENYHGQ